MRIVVPRNAQSCVLAKKRNEDLAMKWTVVIAAVVAALSSFSTAPVYANDLADVVRARANARAGGGTSGHDAWVLKRHGKLSGSNRSSRGSIAKKKAAKKRALLAAKANKRAAAKRRAAIAAKKKKAAQRRAYLLAKKKKEAAKRAKFAAKKKKAKLAALAAKKKAEAQNVASVDQDAVDLRNLDAETKQSTYVATPSNAAVMTSYDLTSEGDGTPQAMSPDKNVAIADTSKAPTVVQEADTQVQRVGAKDQASDENCKRFLPAIGLTISVGC